MVNKLTDNLPMPPDVAKAYACFAPPIHAALMQIRSDIFAEAEARKVGPILETLKWGQPAYLPKRPKIGTSLRLGWEEKSAAYCRLYVPCSTDLLAQYRDMMPEAFIYEGKRAVLIPIEAGYAREALLSCIGLALTYHRRKRQ